MSEPPVMETLPAPVEQPISLAKQFFSRERLVAFGVALAIELLIYFSAMAYPIPAAQQQALEQQAKTLVNATVGQGPLAAVYGIFENNVRIALLEMIPAVGVLLLAVVSFSTGQVIQVEGIFANPSIPGPIVGLLLFVFPFAIVELSSYALAVGSGSMLIVAWRRKMLHREVRVFILEAVVVVVALLCAAAMETVMAVNLAVSLGLWIPTALAIAALIVFGRRMQT